MVQAKIDKLLGYSCGCVNGKKRADVRYVLEMKMAELDKSFHMWSEEDCGRIQG